MPANDSYPFDQPQAKAKTEVQTEEEAPGCKAENAKGQLVNLCRNGWQFRLAGKDGRIERQYFPCPRCQPKAYERWLNPPVPAKTKSK